MRDLGKVSPARRSPVRAAEELKQGLAARERLLRSLREDLVELRWRVRDTRCDAADALAGARSSAEAAAALSAAAAALLAPPPPTAEALSAAAAEAAAEMRTAADEAIRRNDAAEDLAEKSEAFAEAKAAAAALRASLHRPAPPGPAPPDVVGGVRKAAVGCAEELRALRAVLQQQVLQHRRTHSEHMSCDRAAAAAIHDAAASEQLIRNDLASAAREVRSWLERSMRALSLRSDELARGAELHSDRAAELTRIDFGSFASR
eukprot:TRINITY_DN41265_c0_g1_i1.p2 TRINITY_DN41265_c0_g1~~TRINITY_DN41265_c0_g1_i1.p2  ORF type:complete len:262 (+),score=127.23 TRINITY_DN41265_c0_g1_i1:140-925(+)